jgi:hypothetical protein
MKKEKYGKIIDYKYEILGSKLKGQRVKLLRKKKSSFGHDFYVVEFLSDKLKCYNGMTLAGGGRFDYIYEFNIQIEKEKNKEVKK